MGDCSNTSRTHEGSTKQSRDQIDETGEYNIPVETRSLDHVFLWFAQNQAVVRKMHYSLTTIQHRCFNKLRRQKPIHSTSETSKFDLLANIFLKENKEEQEERCWGCHENAPHWKGINLTKWINYPPSHFWVRGSDPLRHGELISVGVLNQVV